MADTTKPRDNASVLIEPVQFRDGVDITGDGGASKASAQIFLQVRNPTDGHVETFDPADGVYAYRAGTTTGTIDVPAAARLRRVSVLANASSATTVTIGGGDTITIPAGGTFDEKIPGLAIGADVIIAGGAPQAYYIAWVA